MILSNDKTIRIESIDGFKETDGSIMIDNEVIYYESVTRGPDAIITPGVSPAQFDKKKQQLENPFTLFDGTEILPSQLFRHSVRPPRQSTLSLSHITICSPGVDYFVEGDEIRFQVALVLDLVLTTLSLLKLHIWLGMPIKRSSQLMLSHTKTIKERKNIPSE